MWSAKDSATESSKRNSIPGRDKRFPFFLMFRPHLRPSQPAVEWVPLVISPEVKRPGREIDHSIISSVDVKNEWSYTSASPIYLRGVGRDSFAFSLYRRGLKSV
jgi:hypothetical protein